MDYLKKKKTSVRCAGYTNNLRVGNVRQPEQKTHRQKPTVRLHRRCFPSVSHEQTSAPWVSYKWGSEDVERGDKKKWGRKKKVLERKAMI